MANELTPEVIRRLSRPGRINPEVLAPGLPKRGKIKIGGRGPAKTAANGNTWYPPVRYDHFEIRQLERGTGKDTNYLRDEVVHNVIGDKPSRVPVMLLYNNPVLNFTSRLGIYGSYKEANPKTGEIANRRGVLCGGDGYDAIRKVFDDKKVFSGERERVACTCILYDEGKCKPNGTLCAIIDVPGVFGIYEFITTGKKSTKALDGSMEFIQDACDGQLAGLPLDLVLRFVKTNTRDGVVTDVPEVTLEPRDGNLPALQERARKMREHKTAIEDRREREHERAAEGVRTSTVFGQTDDEEAEHAEEFFPDDGESKSTDGEPKTAELKSANPDPPAPEREAIHKAQGKPAGDVPSIEDLL